MNASKDAQAAEKVGLAAPKDPKALGACFYADVSSEDGANSDLTGWKVRLEGIDTNTLAVFNSKTYGFLCTRNCAGQFGVYVTASSPELGEDVEAQPLPGASSRVTAGMDTFGVIHLVLKDGGKKLFYRCEDNKDWP